MNRGNLSRRGFMQRSLGALALAGLPTWYAREVHAFDEESEAAKKKTSANDRIRMGVIGSGDRSKQLLRDRKSVV